MRLGIKGLIDFALIIIFFVGFQGGKYFLNNRLQEVGIALTLLLFFYAAIQLAITKKKISWRWWFWSAPLLITYILGSSALIFSVNAGTAIMPSLFAAREFLIIFLAPALYFVYHLGYPLERLEKIFIFSLIIILLNYMVNYFRIDLPSAYFSTGYMSYLVTFDEWRGYRLKPPTFALFLLSIYALLMLFQNVSALKRVGWLLVLCLAAYIWFLIKARSQMAALALAIICYPILFSRPNRMNVLFIVGPVVLFLLIALGGILIDSFMSSEGASVRAASYSLAWDNVKQYPLFGYGQSSAYSKTYQDIFGNKFYPSDLGLIGISFKYGFIGLFIYIFYNFYLLRRIIRINWAYYYHYHTTNPLVCSLLILLTALTINLFLNPGLAYMQGLTVGALTIALTAAHRDEFKKQII